MLDGFRFELQCPQTTLESTVKLAVMHTASFPFV